MDLNCLNGIITDNLAIHIDLTDENSWNLNTGFTSISLNKWQNAVSDNLNLYDFGLTEYDNGRIDRMYSGETFTPQDTKLTLYRVGYNQCITPFSGDTMYDLYPLSAVTTEEVGNYFELNGGYLQGFFKLEKYNLEQFPPRYNLGITIETIIRIDSDSSGTFYHMGLRAEDKYNEYFSGETKQTIETTYRTISNNIVGANQVISETVSGWSGVTTSEEHYLMAYEEDEVLKKAFASLDNGLNLESKWSKVNQSGNTQNNIIAFGLTDDKRLTYQLIDGQNLIRYNVSPNQITNTGWTIIATTFTPDAPIPNYDPTIPNCFERRKGTLSFYVNGRLFWSEKNFDEFYFRGIGNDREKQIGVPYNISWGGGTFGLKHSCHYDTEIHNIYTGETTEYILNNFISKIYPFNANPILFYDLPYAFVNFDVDYTSPSTAFSIPHDPLGDIQFNFNGVTLTNSGTTSSGSTEWDYYQSGRTVTINPLTNITGYSGTDVVTLTYLYDRLGTPTVGEIKYLVYRISPSDILNSGATIQLPETPSGDVQLTIDGTSMTKGDTSFVADYTQDPNDNSIIIIQNASLALYIQSNPEAVVSYIVNTTTTTIEEKSEFYRVDSFNSNKLYYFASINKVAYRLNYPMQNVEDVKITINGNTIQPTTDYQLNPDDPYIIYFPPSINLGDVIGAYYVIDTSNINVGGIAFSGDSDTFVDANDDPITVFRVDYVGDSPQTPSNQYYIEHIEPFEILSNRDYDIHLKIYDPGIFRQVDNNFNRVTSTISLIVYGSEDIEIISETKYKAPITAADLYNDAPFQVLPQEFQYWDPISGLMISGPTGFPLLSDSNAEQLSRLANVGNVTGVNEWHDLKLKFRTKDNTGVQTIYIGVLLNSTASLNNNFVFFMNDWNYVGSDALSKDSTKDNLLIEQNFDKSFNGGIQKLRLYDVSFNSQQILHNAIIEGNSNSAYNLIIQRGGRIIYR